MRSLIFTAVSSLAVIGVFAADPVVLDWRDVFAQILPDATSERTFDSDVTFCGGESFDTEAGLGLAPGLFIIFK